MTSEAVASLSLPKHRWLVSDTAFSEIVSGMSRIHGVLRPSCEGAKRTR